MESEDDDTQRSASLTRIVHTRCLKSCGIGRMQAVVDTISECVEASCGECFSASNFSFLSICERPGRVSAFMTLSNLIADGLNDASKVK